ncbi:c-type cytochrome biogenesis protein CcmI [Limnohabitans sp. Hippo4]|jgi:cytochrome c-type biogenesis protein CcmH|uniref:c-type cytochrome biogenesis protein CcmI n=1 Tax=Limnohabitans sp. Hippo4 TaxID=1826167 RepID=UPI000D3535A5|nr:c-type cytochrome biogenesis protein CcmI [Limnohabitans sp. Hippo4]PUE37815.1 c-type cytochrome biogenesis protein CcmI [Limnohabitans sp. Hippo4]
MSANVLFVVLALGMVLCVAGVLMWVLLRQRPVVTHASQAKANAKVYRDQIADLDREHESGHISDTEWQQSRDELSMRLLEDTSAQDDPVAKQEKPALWTAVLVAVALPLSAVGMYMWVGEPDALNPMAVQSNDKVDPTQLLQMAESLAQKLNDKPDNLQGWVMLGRTYRTLEKFDASVQAYDRALKLSADDDLKLERVEVLAMKSQGNFEGEPWNVIRDILQRDPQNYGALLMAGSASYSHEKFADALKYWQQARKPLAADNPDVPGLDEAIASVQQKLGMPAQVAKGPSAQMNAAQMPVAAPSANTSGAASTGLTVSGQVAIAEALKGKVKPSDVVFIYATPANGERMPLAIFKTTVAQLPLAFTLDDSTAMTPDRKLSGAGEVLVKVRVSKSGNAMPQSGDLAGTLGPVKVGAKGLKLEIKDQIP